MSGGIAALSLKPDDVSKLLAATTHIGSTSCDFQFDQYVYKRRPDGIFLINLGKTWEKLVLAARAIVAIENPADVFVITQRQTSQRAILKFALHTGATPMAGKFTPGTFTNQIQKVFREPRLLIVTDPRVDHQAMKEASYVNLPVIAFCNTDSPMKYVDIAIPCNNKGTHSIGLMWWLLAREVLRLRGKISRELPWEVMVDLYFHREVEETDKEEVIESAPLAEIRGSKGVPAVQQDDDWANDVVADAGAGTVVAPVTDDWNPVQLAPNQESWNAADNADWGNPNQPDW